MLLLCLQKIISRKSKCDNSLGPERKRSKGCKRKKPEEPGKFNVKTVIE